MAERTETVRLLAEVTNYLAGMEKARQATEKASQEAQKLADKKRAVQEVGTAALLMGGAIAAGLVIAVAKFAEFDAKMSQVQSLSHATADEMDQLRNAALHLGQGIGYSAAEVADAQTELVKAGVSVRDILGGGLKGALDLAAAGQLDVAEATSIAASAMTQFKLQGSDVTHIADLLAAGADKALGSVSDLGQGLKYVGPVASGLGISIEQTVGVLAELAQNGILADQAGTSLRGMLSSLTSPSQQAAAVMTRYGISVYDASGQFIGFNGVADQLKTKLGSLDQATRQQALGQIFGNQQITAATVLMDGGAKAVDKWTKSVDDSGFAAQQAAGKMDNLKGDLSKLQAAFDTALIESGSGLNDVLRGLVQGLTGLVSTLGELPAPALTTGLALAGVVSAALLVGGTALTVVPKLTAFRDSLALLGISARTAAIAMGTATVAITAAVAVVALYAQEQAEAAAKVQAYGDTLDSVTNKITTATREQAKNNLATKEGFNLLGRYQGSAYDAAKKLGISYGTVTDAALGNIDAIKRVQAATANFGSVQGSNADRLADAAKKAHLSQGEYQQAASALGFAVQGEAGSIKEAIQIARQKQKADADSADSTDGVADATDGSTAAADRNSRALSALSGAASNAGDEIDDLSKQIEGFGSANIDAEKAESDFQDAIDKAAQSIKDNGKSLDLNTEQGRSNAASLRDIATSALGSSAAIYEQTKSQDQAAAAIQRGRDALIAQLGQYGITGQAAQDYADRLGLIPTNIDTSAKLLTDEATRQAQAYKAFLESIPAEKVTRLKAVSNLKTQFGDAPGFATGGILPGPPSRADNMVIHAASGEFITNAAATAKNRPALEYINRGGRIPHFADGGYVSAGPSTTNAPPSSNRVQTNNFAITEAVDPSSTAESVARRLSFARP